MSDNNVPPVQPPATNPPAGEAAGQQMQLQIREEKMNTVFSNIFRLSATQEDLFLDFAVNMQHHDKPNTVVMDVNTRVAMSFYAAKRLALGLSQAVQRYEQVYGPIQLDPRQRGAR
jgi:hypothetical protein